MDSRTGATKKQHFSRRPFFWEYRFHLPCEYAGSDKEHRLRDLMVRPVAALYQICNWHLLLQLAHKGVHKWAR